MVCLNDQAIVQLQEMIGEDEFPEVFADLVQTYLHDSPTLIHNLAIGAQEKDLQKIQINAHSLKSTSATLGAVQFAELCKQMEIYCLEGKLEEACSLIPQLQEDYQKVEILLNEEVAKL